tara:strand:+ start:503 stop:718 length:216 start_codon:yes stop_codon:yes gene_type:complete
MKMYIEIEVDVDYSFQPFERATLEYPGCDAEVTLESVLFGGVDIEPFLDAKTLDGILTSLQGNLGSKTHED